MAHYSSQFPDPVCLVTVEGDEKSNVMSVGWASPVSSKPPILMVSIAPARFTHDLIIRAGEFGVSILADDQKELSTLGGTLTGRKIDKLARPEFEMAPSEIIGAPLIRGARAGFECRLLSHYSVGDHSIFCGEILRSTVDETKSPLVLFNSDYYSLGEKRGRYP